MNGSIAGETTGREGAVIIIQTMNLRFSIPIMLAAMVWFGPELKGSPLTIYDLTCQYRTDPVGIEEIHPVLGWKLKSQENGQMQTACQVIVASSPDKLTPEKADLWNSGKMFSGQSVAVPYAGRPLQSRETCFWMVKVWDRNSVESGWSRIATWEMALLEPADWQAKWLKHPGFMDTLYESKPAPFFRKTFTSGREVVSARAYVTGLGYFEMYLNGEKVGDHRLDPVKTRYDKEVKYLVFDIGDYLQEGANAVGMVLGTGWYNHFARAAWGFDRAPWREYPTMICQMEIQYADGSSQVVVSDDSWTCSQGPIRFDGIRNGECYDARLEMPGWSETWFDDSQWLSAVEVEGPGGLLGVQQLPAIKEMKEIRPVSVTEIRDGVYVFDLGQNIAGYSRISVAGPEGTTITLKHGERLFPDGSVEQKQILRFLRTGEAQTDTYVLKGEGVETWNPRFVYHGFQYVEVTGLPVEPGLETLTGVVLHTSFDEAGSFRCSDPLMNRIQELTRWSFIGNYHGLPTDCPHREKIGWTGDAHLVAPAGLLNYGTVTSYLKWMDDHVAEQRPGGDLPGVIPTSGWGYEHGRNPETRHLGYGPQWEGSMVLIPWDLYVYTGDPSILERYYDPVRRYIDHLGRNANGYLLEFGIDDHKAWKTKTEGPFIASAYFYRLTSILVKMAEVLQHEEDAKKYGKLAAKIRKAFLREYYDAQSGVVGNGGQTQMALALDFELIPGSEREKVLNRLVERIKADGYFFDCGVVGLDALYETAMYNGISDVIFRMVSQTEFPGYGHWIEQGANTLWQDWDGSMSLNHIMFGSVSEWFYRALAGINPDPERPGFRHVIIAPVFIDDLDWVQAEHETMYGMVRSGWWREEGEITLKIDVPVNCTATVRLPEGERQVHSGNHVFTVGQ